MEHFDAMTRRDVLRTTAAVAAAAAMPAGLFAQGKDQIKVGLIGCGGRGTGAANDAAQADSGVVVWALGDVFPDRANGCRKSLQDSLKERCQVSDDRVFTGFDAYKAVIDSGVDVVLMAAPPGFRPAHFEYAVAKNKHVFCEKPVATDGPGLRQFMAAARQSAEKKLHVVAGTQRRHDPAYRETIQRIRDGAIGEVTAAYAYWNQGSLWMNPRQPNWSDMEWQLRNWLYFTWLAGDIIIEQHIHNIDVCNWAVGDIPVKAISLAGREVRTDPAYGHVFDHFATEYEYANGVRMISMCRQIDGCANRVSEWVVGSKGSTNCNGFIRGENAWRFEGQRVNPYVEEHKNLFAAVRGGSAVNEAVQVGETTLTAMMGRMAGYTGQEVTRDMALNSEERLVPETFSMGEIAVPKVAVPGVDRVR